MRVPAPLSRPLRRRRLARFVAPLVGVAAAATVLSACSTPGDSTVLSVNGAKLSRTELESDLKAYADSQINAKTTAEERKAESDRYHGTDKDKKTWNADYTAFIIDRRMIDRIIDEEFTSLKLPAATLKKETKDQLVQVYGGKAIYEKLPKRFVELAEKSAAEYDAIVDADVKKLGDPKAYFTKNQSQFGGEVCASHILVATKAEADAIEKDLAAGEDFAEIAKAKSTDTGSGANGGDLGCAAPDTYVPEFAAATKTLEIGKISDPVQTQFGFHIIKVTKRTDSTYDSAKAKVDTAMSQEAGSAVTKRLVERLTNAKVTVDPSFGAYVKTGQNGYPQIVSKASADAAAKAAAAAAKAPTEVPANGDAATTASSTPAG